MIHLEKVDYKNVWDIIDLEVSEAQKEFVASNTISLVQAYTAIGTECSAFPFGIFDEKTAVGFLMVGFNEAVLYEEDEPAPPTVLHGNYSIWRLMIDQKYQGKGYGRQAMQLALDFVRTFPCGKAELCEISYEPENTVARELYASFGFVENGEKDGDETVAVLKL